jgi:hypothetical protein
VRFSDQRRTSFESGSAKTAMALDGLRTEAAFLVLIGNQVRQGGPFPWGCRHCRAVVGLNPLPLRLALAELHEASGTTAPGTRRDVRAGDEGNQAGLPNGSRALSSRLRSRLNARS